MVSDEPSINLRIPGPTPLPPAVRAAMSRQMINHRGPEYAELQEEVLDGLRYFFQTDHDVLLFTGSGTGGLEAAVVNTLSPGDHVLAVTIGAFGERFAGIAEAFGAQMHRLAIPWGLAVKPQALAAALAEHPTPSAVLLTCNETSTGVMNDLHTLAPLIHAAEPRPLLLVDAISALGAIALPMDGLGIDVLVTASQKAWMAPPGITMLGVSPTAWRRHATARMPRFYWDFTKQRKAQSKGQDAWTPAMGTMFALQEALRLMRSEGREAIVARHRHIAALAQQGLLDLGLRLFAEQGHRSLTVTAACVPDDVDGAALIRQAREYGLVVGGGQEMLAGKIIRLGHMGWVEDEHITSAIAALGRSLAALGSSATAGSTIVAGG